MSSAVFPSLTGATLRTTRSASWEGGSEVVTALSGKDTSITYWSYPRWEWELNWDLIRQGTRHGTAYTEAAQLWGFYNARQGTFDSFLFEDTDDNTATAAALGTGNGSNRVFQLMRSYGSFLEPIFALKTMTNVFLNGSPVSGALYSVSAWGTASPGQVTFNSAPGNGVAVTATFTFYWPCRFVDNRMTLDKFMAAMWENKGVTIRSIK